MEIEKVLGAHYPWCAGWAAELKGLFAAYVEAKQAQHVLDYDDLLLYWSQMMSDALIAEEIGGRFDHVWSTNIRTPTACNPRSCWR